jgi:hypothetical protein
MLRDSIDNLYQINTAALSSSDSKPRSQSYSVLSRLGECWLPVQLMPTR